MSTTEISPNVDSLSLAAVDGVSHQITSWGYNDDHEAEIEWHESVRYTDDADRDHILIVSGGTVVALYIDGVTFDRFEYDRYAERFADEPDMDENEYEALFDLSPGDNCPGASGPAMSYWYNAPMIDDARIAAGKLVGLPLCVVEVDGEMGLALTGGGMDLTWEIVAAYVALGALPPYRYASDLPGMGGRGKDDADKVLIAACLRTLTVTAERATYAADRLREQAEAWANR